MMGPYIVTHYEPPTGPWFDHGARPPAVSCFAAATLEKAQAAVSEIASPYDGGALSRQILDSAVELGGTITLQDGSVVLAERTTWQHLVTVAGRRMDYLVDDQDSHGVVAAFNEAQRGHNAA